MHSGFKPKPSVSDPDIKEKASIFCLDALLLHPEIKTHFTLNDKTANIDGKIELLTDRLICGNISVQIKTYPKKYYSKSKFDFPSSIFGYAKNCPIELVLLIAVDKEHNIAYWKHISKSLIIIHEDKCNQKKITLHFEDDEVIKPSNTDDIIKKWKTLYKTTSDLINQVEEINIENEQYKLQLKNYQNPIFTIPKESIIKLQKFIDKYNQLLDFEFNYIKRHYYSNPWKMAIAIFEYGSNDISYILHKIEYGENGLIVKEIPINQVDDFKNYSVMHRNCVENEINDNPEKYASILIQNKVIEMLENKTVLFLTEDTANEYIFDFISKEGRYLEIKQETTYDLVPLQDILKVRYPNISEPYYVAIGNHRLNLNILFECIQFLIEKGFTYIYRPYPAKGHYGNTGFISDFFTPDLAFKKFKFAYELLPSLFDAFMITAFPYLRNSISFYGGYDLILINLTYQNGAFINFNQDHQIASYSIRLCEGRIKPAELIVSLNFQSDIYTENKIESHDSMKTRFYSRKKISYQGGEYEIMAMGGEDIRLLYDEYYIHNMLYKYLTERFKDYFVNQNKK